MRHDLRELGLAWCPQEGPQRDLVQCPADWILYGGARGGGKTNGILGRMAVRERKLGRAMVGIIFRKTLVQLEEAMAESQSIYRPMGAKWMEQKKTWIWPSGARLKFRYIERDSDAEAYQGHSYSDVNIDEAGNFADPKPIRKLLGTLRSPYGAHCQMIMSANPGGVGHQWLKGEFITPARFGYRPLVDEASGLVKMFIPAGLKDNRILMEKDPRYVSRLRAVGSEALVRAWLEGDWDVVAGAFFDRWATRHILPAFTPPKGWARFRSFDWGSARPFSVQWWAVADGEPVSLRPGHNLTLPRGAVVLYREWYGMVPGQPNTGLKLDAEVVAEGIMERDAQERTMIAKSVADPSIFRTDGGPSIAERMARHRHAKLDYPGVIWTPADNQRIPGWDQMRQRIEGIDGVPMLYVMDNCVDFIRTVPYLQHDELKPEDVDTDAEDHCLHGLTPVDTDRGRFAIRDLVGSEGSVWTAKGWRRFVGCRMTRRMAAVVRLTFEDGAELICTPDHLLLTERGWMEAGQCRSVLVFRSGVAPDTGCAAATTRTGREGFTGWWPRPFMAPSLPGVMSITSMGILPTTIPRIWPLSMVASTVRTMAGTLLIESRLFEKRLLLLRGRLQGRGMPARKGGTWPFPARRRQGAPQGACCLWALRRWVSARGWQRWPVVFRGMQGSGAASTSSRRASRRTSTA